MEFVYLGFLEQLQKAISSTVGKLVSLVLEKVLGFIVSAIMTIIKEALYTIWLHFFRTLLKAISFLVRVMDVLSGMTSIGVQEGKTVKDGGSLLEYILTASTISRLFLGMTVVAVALAFLFSVYETGKTISDSALEPKARPISKVITGGIRCMLTFMLVPMLCIGCLQLSSAMLKEVKISFDTTLKERSGHTEFSDVLFELSAESGLKVKKDPEKGPYKEFWDHKQPYLDEGLLKEETVYDLKKIDYFVGILSSLVILVIMLGACLAFVRRIIEVVLLYVVSPYFAATIALDGGKRFAGWREQFIGAFFGCFGSVFAMRLYLIMIPLVATDQLVISGNTQVNYIAKICFIIGCSWAIFRSQKMITELISPQGSRGANESAGLVTGIAFGLGKKAGRGASGLISGLGGR